MGGCTVNQYTVHKYKVKVGSLLLKDQVHSGPLVYSDEMWHMSQVHKSGIKLVKLAIPLLLIWGFCLSQSMVKMELFCGL